MHVHVVIEIFLCIPIRRQAYFLIAAKLSYLPALYKEGCDNPCLQTPLQA